MRQKNLFIRADSGFEIGIGHIMRCFALAEILKDMDFDVNFISKKLNENIYNFIVKKGYKVHIIPDNNQNKKHNLFSTNITNKKIIKNDAIETTKIIIKNNDKPSWVLVDHRDLDIQWETILRECVERIIVIDDLANKKHDCDLLIDQNLYEEMDKRYINLVPKNCKKLLGPKYALLRSEFFELRKNLSRNIKQLRNILISFGGSDPSNETCKVLDAIKILNIKNIKVDVVVGSVNPYKEKIKQICSSIPNTTFYCDVDKIGALMTKADLAIGAGGITTWERCCLGLPSMVSIISEDQLECTETMGEKGYIINLGRAKNLTAKDYVEKIKNININKLQTISKLDLEIVDGKGCQRIASVIKLL